MQLTITIGTSSKKVENIGEYSRRIGNISYSSEKTVQVEEEAKFIYPIR